MGQFQVNMGKFMENPWFALIWDGFQIKIFWIFRFNHQQKQDQFLPAFHPPLSITNPANEEDSTSCCCCSRNSAKRWQSCCTAALSSTWRKLRNDPWDFSNSSWETNPEKWDLTQKNGDLSHVYMGKLANTYDDIDLWYSSYILGIWLWLYWVNQV